MFGFHKPKMYRSLDGCCICRAKSSSSRFTDSKRYERDFNSCFGLSEVRFGEICNACVLLVKRWKKLPAGSIKNWNHVVDAKGSGSSWKTVRSKKMKRTRPSQIRVQKELKRHNSDAHSTTSSASPAHSPSYSNQSDEGSDVELSPGATHSPVFSFLDLTYWKRLNSQVSLMAASPGSHTTSQTEFSVSNWRAFCPDLWLSLWGCHRVQFSGRLFSVYIDDVALAAGRKCAAASSTRDASERYS
ncbi:SIN3-HDAC complex-associated factor-like isoform X1 [Oncorhynchus masou masou]|uniref:SIN3-HDAC complex-associated factor-like isoform X1 n=1 Tax=Oncorhynchus masou masou TaxID=90313 RepID=UPI003182D32E